MKFDGLYSYEVVLLVLGVVLFLALVTLLVVLAIKSKPFAKLLAFFAIPIIMIGYPSIKSIQFGDNVVTIEKNTEALKKNPNDRAAREELKATLTNIKGRPVADAATLTKIERAQALLKPVKGGTEMKGPVKRR